MQVRLGSGISEAWDWCGVWSVGRVLAVGRGAWRGEKCPLGMQGRGGT